MSTSRLMKELQQRLGGGVRPSPRPLTPPARPGRPARPSAQSGGYRNARLPRKRQAPGAEILLHPPLLPHDPARLEQLKRATPAKVGVGRSGLRYRTQTALQFQADFAVAQAAVESLVPEEWVARQGLIPLQTEVTDHEQFLLRPDLGRRLDSASLERVRARGQSAPDVQIVVGDGLSANAVMLNAPGLVQSLSVQLARRRLSVGTLFFVRYCRTKVIDVVGQTLGARVGIILVGERPGLGTGDGMSAYLVYDPHHDRVDAEKQCISNIHRRGLLPEQAGEHAANIIEAAIRQQTSGVKLDLSGIPLPERVEGTTTAGRPRANQANPDASLGCGQSHGQQCAACQTGLPGAECGRSDHRPCETRTH